MAKVRPGQLEVTTGTTNNDTVTTKGYVDDSTGLELGKIEGLIVKYNTATVITITSGSCEANGKSYTLASDTTHTMTSLVVALDIHYVYIDDSASSPPTAVFIDSTTEPTWNNAKRGWYNGDDRCIGVAAGTEAVATITNFWSSSSGKNVILRVGIGIQSGISIMASGQPTTGSWQTPNVYDGSVVTSVNAIRGNFRASNSQSAATVLNAITNSEHITSGITGGQLAFEGYNFINNNGWIVLGPSRNVKIAGYNANDDLQLLYCVGYEYAR